MPTPRQKQHPAPAPVNYILKMVDGGFWARVRSKAQGEGHQIKWVILQLLEAWLRGDVRL